MGSIPLDTQPEAPVGFRESAVPHPPVLSGIEAYSSGEQGQGVGVGRWDQWVARTKAGYMESPVGIPGWAPGASTRWAQEFYATGMAEKAGVAKLTPEQANQKYPGINATEAVYPEVAKLRFDTNKKKAHLQDWMSRGADMGGAFSPFNLTSGAVTSVLEPFNFAANIATGGAAKALGVTSTFRNLLVQNLATSAVGDTFNYLQTTREGQEPNLSEMIGGSIKGAVMSAGFFKGLHVAFEGLKSSRVGESQESLDNKIKTLVAQHESESRLDLTPQEQAAEARRSGAIQPGKGEDPYVYRALNHPSETSNHSPVTGDGYAPLNDFTEGGVTGTDRSMEANNLASNPEGLAPGKIHEWNAPKDGKFMDLETSIADGEGKAFIAQLESRLGEKLDLPPETTLKQVISEIASRAEGQGNKSEVLNVVQDLAKEQGFSGYKYVNEDKAGNPVSNHTHVFDQGVTQHVAAYEADPSITPQTSAETAQSQFEAAQRPDNSVYHSDDVAADVQKLKSQPVANPAMLDPVTENQAKISESFLKEKAAADPTLQEELDASNKVEDPLIRKNQSLGKKILDCMIGGGQ